MNVREKINIKAEINKTENKEMFEMKNKAYQYLL